MEPPLALHTLPQAVNKVSVAPRDAWQENTHQINQ